MIEGTPLFVALTLLAYVVGSVNVSVLASRLLGIGDVRKVGSGNPGATNLLRLAGPKVAVPVLLIDIGKAIGVIWLARFLGAGAFVPLLAIPLILGNLFPLFHRFRGGKGVAAATGAVLAVSPFAMLLGGGVFLLVLLLFRRMSVGSMAMTLSFAPFSWLLGGTAQEIVGFGALFLIVLFSHRSNLKRIVGGTEPKFRFKKEGQR